jgi:hypothetical protein
MHGLDDSVTGRARNVAGRAAVIGKLDLQTVLDASGQAMESEPARNYWLPAVPAAW